MALLIGIAILVLYALRGLLKWQQVRQCVIVQFIYCALGDDERHCSATLSPRVRRQIREECAPGGEPGRRVDQRRQKEHQ